MTEQIVLHGDKVGLGVVQEEHVEHLVRWLNDLQVIPGASSRQLHTVTSARSGPAPWFTDSLNAGERALRFAVVSTEDSQLVGTTEIYDIDYRTRTAEFGIFMGVRSKGYGTEATSLTIDWAFNVLGVRNLILRVGSWQTSAIAVYERCGFRHIGARRDAHAFAGRTFDETWMDITPADFDSSGSRVIPALPQELTAGL